MPEIEVPAPPVPKARPRLAKGHVFTPRTTELAEHRIRQAWIFGPADTGQVDITEPLIRPVQCPVYVEVLVRVARPVGHFGSGRNAARLLPSAPRWPAVRPDLDNYAKTALDALRGVAFVDDGQIVRLYLAKVYARDGEVPGWRIGVFPMEDTSDADSSRPEGGGAAEPAGERAVRGDR